MGAVTIFAYLCNKISIDIEIYFYKCGNALQYGCTHQALKFPTLHHKFYATIQVAMTRCAQLPKGGLTGGSGPNKVNVTVIPGNLGNQVIFRVGDLGKFIQVLSNIVIEEQYFMVNLYGIYALS